MKGLDMNPRLTSRWTGARGHRLTWIPVNAARPVNSIVRHFRNDN